MEYNLVEIEKNKMHLSQYRDIDARQLDNANL